MKKSLYTIAENSLIAAKTYKMVLAPLSFRPSEASGEICLGEFVDIGIPGYFLRRPLSVCDWEEGRLTLVYKVVGEGTKVLSEMPVGGELEVLTGLGKGFGAGSGRCWWAADWGFLPCSCWPSG